MEKKIDRLSYVGSTFLWIVVLFLSANYLWGFIRPLETVPHTSQPNLELSKAALRFKMDELKTDKRPDILIIGSSLPMCAFFYTESPPFFDLKEGAKIHDLHLNLLQAYPEAGYFTAKLKKLCQKDLSIFNFAGAACMVSDTKLVLERSLAAQKKPRLIIYGVGLRDFVDNVNPPPGETPYYKALCNLPFLLRHISQIYYFHSFTDLSICALCKMYDLRNEFRLTAEHLACETFHHPSSLQIAFILGDLNRQLKASHDKDLEGGLNSRAIRTKTALSVHTGSITNSAALIANSSVLSAASGTVRTAASSTVTTEASNTVRTASSTTTEASNTVRTASSTTTEASNTVRTASSTTTEASNTATAGASNTTTTAISNIKASTSTAIIPSVRKDKVGDVTMQHPYSANFPALSVLDYPLRYTPANYARLNDEMSELQHFISACKREKIKLVLVNMPVSQGHKGLSPPGLREKYLQKLRIIAPNADLFIDYENDALPDSYFFDTVHLNGTGSVKFVDDLSGRLQSSRLLQDL